MISCLKAKSRPVKLIYDYIGEMLISSGWRCYAFTLLLTTISCKSRANRTLGPCISRPNRTLEAAGRPVLALQATPGRHRFRRAGVIQELTEDDKQKIVDLHNDYRRKEGASNMKKLIWNDYLAQMAADWAKRCDYNHGQPQRDANAMPYQYPGQNLFASGADKGFPHTIDQYMAEKKLYSNEKKDCDGGDCGHYKQVVWAVTEAVGCAYTKCDNLQNFYRNSFFYVCNYGPGMEGEVMYMTGSACSTCVENQWCDQGLCVRDCNGLGKHCVCGSACQHCGKADGKTCTCKCADGYMGPDCAEKCQEKQDCKNLEHKTCITNEFLRRECPGLCGICKVAAPGAPEQNCPVDKIASASDSTVWSSRLLKISLQQHLLIEILLLLCLHNNQFTS